MMEKILAVSLPAAVIAIGIWVGAIQTEVAHNSDGVAKIEKVKEDVSRIDERTRNMQTELRAMREEIREALRNAP